MSHHDFLCVTHTGKCKPTDTLLHYTYVRTGLPVAFTYLTLFLPLPATFTYMLCDTILLRTYRQPSPPPSRGEGATDDDQAIPPTYSHSLNFEQPARRRTSGSRDLGRTGVPPFVPRYVSVWYVPYGPDRACVASWVLYRYRVPKISSIRHGPPYMQHRLKSQESQSSGKWK
jgi:hypothetical protein